MYYRYKGVDYMQEHLSNYDFQPLSITICAYRVNTEGKYPFQEFLMVNNPCSELNELMFPFMMLPQLTNDDEKYKKEILYQASYVLSHIIDFNFISDVARVDGFTQHDNEIFIFMDITKSIKENLFGHFVLIDEIMNRKKMNNSFIKNSITSFFELNDSYCFLLDENENLYEVPIVAYTYKDKSKLNFTSIFGETNKNGILGPYYYFTSYKFSNDNKPKGGGIIRFAIFTGKTKYIENMPNDPTDDSIIKNQRLLDEKLDYSYEVLTIRITDYEGKWSNNYDSAYLGNLELDNGEHLKPEDTCILVIKNYNQQVPLSVHF